MSEHRDLDALADVLAGSRDDHVAGCDACQARLAQLEQSLPAVTSALAALAAPPEPAHLGTRLEQAVAAERATASGDGNVLPLASRRRTRWLPVLGAAAAVAVVAGGTALLLQKDDSARDGGATYALSNTGTDYARNGQALRAALPSLLEGGAPAAAPEAQVLGAPEDTSSPRLASPNAASTALATAADPLAALRTDAGLASCLVALGDPADPDAGLPLALDYASYEGQPALVVVLPSGKPDKVDVFVVGAGCSQADAKLLFFTRLTKP